jgi:hypothetical protein
MMRGGGHPEVKRRRMSLQIYLKRKIIKEKKNNTHNLSHTKKKREGREKEAKKERERVKRRVRFGVRGGVEREGKKR